MSGAPAGRGRRRVILGLAGAVALWAVCATRGRVNGPREPAAGGAGPATLAHWNALGGIVTAAGRSSDRIADHGRTLRAGGPAAPAGRRAFWERYAALYDEAAGDAKAAVAALDRLPTQGVDPAALGVDVAARKYLAVRADLDRVSAKECCEYAAIYAEAAAPGFDSDGPAGRNLARREDELLARMAGRIDAEGRAEKAALAGFVARAVRVRAELVARYGLVFDIIGEAS